MKTKKTKQLESLRNSMYDIKLPVKGGNECREPNSSSSVWVPNSIHARFASGLGPGGATVLPAGSYQGDFDY